MKPKLSIYPLCNLLAKSQKHRWGAGLCQVSD